MTPVASKNVSIIIVAYNALEYSRICLQAIREFTAPGYELILVNNGSRDGTHDYFAAIPGARVITNDINRGFAGGYNQGMQAAGTPYLLLINNDCVVSHNWLPNMLACAESDPGIGIVGPRANRVPGRQNLEHDFHDLNELHAFAGFFNQPDSSRWFPLSRLSGFCLLLKKEVVQKIGYFDEAFGAGTHEDTDYCLRARLAGFKLFCAGDVFIYHYSHRTFIANNINLQKLYHYNKYLLERKWSGNKLKKSNIFFSAP